MAPRLRILVSVLAVAFPLTLMVHFYLCTEVEENKPKAYAAASRNRRRDGDNPGNLEQAVAELEAQVINGSFGDVQRLHRKRNPTILFPPPGAVPFHQFGANSMIENPEEFALNMSKTRLRLELFGIPNVKRSSYSFGLEQQGKPSPIRNADGSPRQVLILTYFRSGSTFLGDVLNNYPGTFYHFEPLHFLSLSSTLDSEKNPENVTYATSVVRQLLHCDYSNLTDYLNWVRIPQNQFLMEHNKRFWGACRIQKRLCFEPGFLGSMCKEHPLHVMKLVRLRLREASLFLEEDPNLKIIHLIRDPRGMYSSRIALDWCREIESCVEPKSICAEMRSDLEVGIELKKKYPDRYLMLRYEDLSLNPMEYSSALLRFLGLPYHGRIRAFVTSHTKGSSRGADIRDPYSTRRDSKKAPFLWRKRLAWDEVKEVQDQCSDVIAKFRYNLYPNAETLERDAKKLDSYYEEKIGYLLNNKS